MSQYKEGPCGADTAAAAIAQFLRVKTTGALAVAGVSDVELGTMEIAALAAGDATVRYRTAAGTVKMVAVEAITAGNPVYAAASGKVAASGALQIGTAIEAATADNDVIEVLRGDHSLQSVALTEVVAATNVITASESGSVFFLNSATEFVSTLPALQAGLRFTFIVSAAPSGASYTIVTASSANIIKGQAYTLDVNSGTDPDFETAGCDTISFVDAKAVAGDRVEVICDGTNWFAYGFSSVFDAITFTTAS